MLEDLLAVDIVEVMFGPNISRRSDAACCGLELVHVVLKACRSVVHDQSRLGPDHYLECLRKTQEGNMVVEKDNNAGYRTPDQTALAPHCIPK